MTPLAIALAVAVLALLWFAAKPLNRNHAERDAEATSRGGVLMEESMTDTGQINDFETALNTWDMVADANNLVWTLDEDELPRWAHGDFWAIRDFYHQPTPPFTNAYAQEDQ